MKSQLGRSLPGHSGRNIRHARHDVDGVPRSAGTRRPEQARYVMDLAASMQRTRPAALAAVVALLLALPLCGGGTLGGTPTSTSPQQSYLLRVDDGAMAAVTSRVQSLGGTVQHRLDGLGAAVVRIPASAADALRSTAGVLGVTPDSPLQLLGSGYSASADAGSMYNVAQVTGARKTWASGFTGKRCRRGPDRLRRHAGRGPRRRRQGGQRTGPVLRVAEQRDPLPGHLRSRHVHGRHHRRQRRVRCPTDRCRTPTTASRRTPG